MIQAIAKVQLTVEVDAGQPWGEECTISQVHKQATESAKRILLNAIAKEKPGIRIVGEPKITSIITVQQ